MSVLDASVVLKWFVDEEDSDQALQLRDEFYTGENEEEDEAQDSRQIIG
ncbi:MAG: hypothetical protein J7J22_03015 [Candidatus Verstraetearchaeota archaeon]|nr:hypothetical protein [Candidatus Verstraetearchaeota archaeon]